MATIRVKTVKNDKLSPEELELVKRDIELLEESQSIISIMYLITKTYLPASISFDKGDFIITLGENGNQT